MWSSILEMFVVFVFFSFVVLVEVVVMENVYRGQRLILFIYDGQLKEMLQVFVFIFCVDQ